MKNKFLFGMIVILCSIFVSAADDTCSPDWSCVDWSDCIENNQTRICNDLNFCGTESGKPSETRKCTSETTDELPVVDQSAMPSAVTCLEDWKCAPWLTCIDGKQARECFDQNSCGLTTKRPILEQACVVSVAPVETDIIATPVVTQEPSSFWSYVFWFLGFLFLGAIGIVAYAYFTPSTAVTSSASAQTYSLNPELSKYVFQMKSAGYSNEQIRNSMLNSGYEAETVNRYLPQQNPQLHGYTRQMLDQGYNTEQIEDHLVRHGLNRDEIRMNISLFKSR